jgi:hypothetical protein
VERENLIRVSLSHKRKFTFVTSFSLCLGGGREKVLHRNILFRAVDFPHLMGAGNTNFITRKLWGIANSGPFMHHGKFTTMREAILCPTLERRRAPARNILRIPGLGVLHERSQWDVVKCR